MNCSFCHGSDARGGEGGPNLVRSQLVMDDKDTELIGPVILNGRVSAGMPKFSFSNEDVKAVTDFIHSIPANADDFVSPSAILVGDPKAGEAYFNGPGKCNSCHSATGDLAGVGAKYEVRILQDKLVFPAARQGGGGAAGPAAPSPAVAVTVTPPSSTPVHGKLEYIDDFTVGLTDADGQYHSFTRNGGVPKVELQNPLEAHRQLLRTISDTEIHNLTAYLETLK